MNFIICSYPESDRKPKQQWKNKILIPVSTESTVKLSSAGTPMPSNQVPFGTGETGVQSFSHTFPL